MQLITVKDQFEGGKKAFEILNEEMQANRVNVLGLATGSTPITFYEEIVKSDLDFSEVTSVNLDEYIGLAKSDDQSYDYFMHEHLFNVKPFKENFLPDGLATDVEAECQRYDEVLKAHPVDIQILGIGENAHIGFNEPGSSFEAGTQKVALTESTIEANSRNFEKIEDVPTHAISMGIKSIMAAKKIILLAYGEKKAEAIKNTIEGPITEDVPSSVLQRHQDVIIIADEAATSLLTK
ncbi:glucosamine-6-phosphate deaminase [Vagococcus zengguangii]|uniref:Glucosamine-6-phosphate deaminase n=1 Tax=Vagococcus zengguangii TaxID=2571750 RepID=A0A4D7CT80_9ENTE|nr:glucosamine-6-phosphate deaminase [Vagococcus zengguangii]QCI86012.1 glucosamine-6-phosphate deaminase [Vagococcus zengguangii]TLG80243.1 glucosamine-6-phosphate deaminase [Vagococcus zengguangii]